MAKSRLSRSRFHHKDIKQSQADASVIPLDLSVELRQAGIAHNSKFNFIDWCHVECDPNKALATPSRLNQAKKLKTWVELERRNRTSDSSIRSKLTALKIYITFCDRNNLDPFSKVGYLAYAGNLGELWRLVKSASERKNYNFQYNNGDDFGLLEASAYNKKVFIDRLLLELDFDVSELQATIKSFSANRIESSTEPYSTSEFYTLIRRTQLFFSSLASQLISFKEAHPTSPPPSTLDNVVVERENGHDITITLGGNRGSDGAANLFNQCMSAAYTLFAYYTAFNDTVIRDVRHPIKVITSKVEGKTSKVTQVRAYKGRSSKDVYALFAGESEQHHPQATENNAGFIVATVKKRDSFSNRNGIEFIQTLEQLSKAYSNESFESLIYFLDSAGKKAKVSVHLALEYLSQNLSLLSSRKGDLSEHLVKTYSELVVDKKITTFKWVQKEDGNQVMLKQSLDVTGQVLTKRASPLAYAAISSLTDIPLRDALIPLRYSDKDADGNIVITFNYMDGSEGTFEVSAKYINFFKLVESYAQKMNPLPNDQGSRSSSRPCFLIPLGSRNQTYQWNRGTIPVSNTLLRLCGIRYGEFFLNITSSRVRLTHSDLEYKPEDRGITAQKILQHTQNVADKRYQNGHPISNAKQVSQGLMVLSQIAEGKTRNDASEAVKTYLRIPILEYDSWKLRNQPTNPNGIACSGQIDLVADKDWHYAARKFAKDKGIISENQDITCYQYDLCIFCRSAKLVDDAHAVYKLMSFIDALSEAIDLYAERASIIEMKIERFQNHLESLPIETLEQAEDLLETEGRYFLFNSVNSVTQFL